MKSMRKWTGICKWLLCVGILLLSISGRAAAQVPIFIYVGNRDSGNVSAYSINASTGALTPVPGSPFATGTSPFGVALDPSRKFVYVGNNGSSNVSAYTIDATSVLADFQ